MFTAWMLMLAAGNLGYLMHEPRLFVSYWFCLPIGLLLGGILEVRTVRMVIE